MNVMLTQTISFHDFDAQLVVIPQGTVVKLNKESGVAKFDKWKFDLDNHEYIVYIGQQLSDRFTSLLH